MDSYEDEDVKGARSLSSEPPPDGAPEPPPAAQGEVQPPARTEHVPASRAEDQPGAVPASKSPSVLSAQGSALRSAPGAQTGPQAPSAPPMPGTEASSGPFAAGTHTPPAPHPGVPVPLRGIAALSLPYQVAAALSLALIGVFACVHLAMVFLHVAPSNTVTKEHGGAVDGWVYPEFEQNWKLFAPNPLQQNVAVEVKAEYTADDGSHKNTDWIDLTAEDGEAIRGNLLPSHVQQNELRRAWDFYVNSHDNENRGNGLRGQLSESYVRRIVMQRLDAHDLGGPVERIRLRSSTRSVKAPEWSDEKIDTRAAYRVLPWWTVTAADLPGGVRNDRTEAGQ
ncbi:DUF5819 family protein [Streptomyces sp. CA-135486]|uniref:DUF5819 family protein n=1 Tax=Streptomyces sp. CA-135486 TaxID=3240049 RepID=UPI003D932EFD